MFKKLTIINFENHKKTIIDFDENLTLICGKSNAGKSSILRAIQVVLYNNWDPRSLRIGSNIATIKLETDKGFVKVTKGKKKNEWIVKKDGEEEKEFKNIGRKILDEVVEVTGIKPVKLGNFEVTPNIMDQLESHFMLSSVSGDDISGSTRAQIIDEISGLAGMEELIREVSLDNHRNTRSMNEIENGNVELKEKMHNKNELQEEKKLLDSIESKVKEYSDKTDKSEKIIVYKDKYNKLKSEYDDLQRKLNSIPDVKCLEEKITDAKEAYEISEQFVEIHEEYKRTKSNYDQNKKLLKMIPDLDDISNKSDMSKMITEQEQDIRRIKFGIDKCNSEISECEEKLKKIPDVDVLKCNLDKANSAYLKAKEVERLLKTIRDIKNEIKKCEDFKIKTNLNSIDEKQIKSEKLYNKISDLEMLTKKTRQIQKLIDEDEKNFESTSIKLTELIKERGELLSNIDVCPITMMPISEACRSHVRIPVTDEGVAKEIIENV